MPEFCIAFAVAPSGSKFLRSSWFNLAIILLSPPFMMPDAFQAAMAAGVSDPAPVSTDARAGTGNHWPPQRAQGARFTWLPYVLVTAAAIGLGAIGIYRVERGFTIDSPSNALLVGDRDSDHGRLRRRQSVTAEGRAIALILMLVGVGVISIFTASVASFFVGDDKREAPAGRRTPEEPGGQVGELVKELKRVRSVE